jgi:hypothetical protein
MKLPSTAAFEALSDIGHNRYGSSLDLPAKPKIFGKGSLLSHLISCSSQLSGLLLGTHILKPICLTQHSSLSTQRCPLNCFRNSCRNTFPSALRGNAGTNCTIAGFLKLARRW